MTGVAMLTVAAVGCGVRADIETPDTASNGADAEQAVTQVLIDRQAIASTTGAISLSDLFPRPGTHPIDQDAFVGDVVAVEPGKAFQHDFQANQEVEVPFDDPAADWRSYYVRLSVVETFVGNLKPSDEATIGLAFPPDPQLDSDTVVAGFQHMGRLVVFTAPGRYLFADDPAVMPVAGNGGFISAVDGDSVPSQPLKQGAGVPVFASKFDTQSELRALASSGAS